MFEKFLPDMRVDSVFDIDLEELYAQGYRGIITDLDNTLVGAKAPLATPELIEWFAKVKENGFKLVIVSNNNLNRVSVFAGPLNIEFVHAAKKPSGAAFRRAVGMMGLKPEETIVVGDQLMTDVFGGNRQGLYTVLVLPISVQDEGMGTRINRRLERVVKRRLSKIGLWLEEESKQ
ncbi:YqeG family HAD IIIA-type phosphatase [Paenibacillus senegalimassiliensis]|uniref:YqeG family HAD IIIA-type phosphatase n=1 Tax=Paenibacillus senegalimassiliensis TaxID=1737426 RepID=UPI00073E5480|nr:YqeG family HAD IIIA-type phosphatase [Paenibacillus senegalimassiliensis]